MKKLLSIIGAVGLTATATTAVISCSNSEKNSYEHLRFQEIMKMNELQIEALHDKLHQEIYYDEDFFELYNYMKETIILEEEILPAELTQEQFNKVHWKFLELRLVDAINAVKLIDAGLSGPINEPIDRLLEVKLDLIYSIKNKLVNKEDKVFARNVIDYIDMNFAKIDKAEQDKKERLSELLKIDPEKKYLTNVSFDENSSWITHEEVLEIIEDVLSNYFKEFDTSNFDFTINSFEESENSISIIIRFTVSKDSWYYKAENFFKTLNAYWEK